MKVALVHNAKLPVQGYGGTERVVWWLGKALAARGVSVVLVSSPGTECSWAQIIPARFEEPIEPQIPKVDLIHFFNTPATTPSSPYLVTIEGNGKPGEVFARNTAFVSRNHALRHGAECFVHNGVDPDDYIFNDKKDGSLLFLAKASWHVKNVKGAIRYARQSHRELHILGGHRWLFNHWGGVHWHGMLGGQEKSQKIARASALLFPVLWNEPFGLAVVEAMISGTPVLASARGSLPELIPPIAGRICRSDEEFLAAIEDLGRFVPQHCRDWAVERFSHHRMAEKYVELYERVLSGEALNSTIPVTQDPLDALDSIPWAVGNKSAQPA